MKHRIVISIGLALALPVSAHEGHSHEEPAAPTTAAALARLPDGTVNIPKLAQRRIAIRTLLSAQSEAAATLELPARVVQDPNAGGLVQSAHGGRIEPGPRGLPVAGQRVRQGEVLAFVRHHTEPYARAGQESQRAELRAARELAQSRVQRLESLAGTVPRKEIEAARVEADSLLARERSIGASLDAREALRAPVSGVVARADLAAGRVVEPRDVLLEIIDPARLMVEALTPDPALAARIASASLAGQPSARLQLIGAASALRDGLLPLTFRAQGATALALGQTLTLVVATKDKTRGIVLPAEALVRNPANEPVVWVKASAERFVAQPVRAHALDANTVLVTQGLQADARVVVQGAALIAQIR